MNLELTIEELVLHGIPHHQHQMVIAALETELARLFRAGDRAALPAIDHRPEIDVQIPQSTGAAAPQTQGVAIAQAIYGGITP